MIGIRVDANDKIASGHVMRCIAIAKQIEKSGMKCIFISSDEYPRCLIEKHNFDMIVLNTEYDNMDSEISKLEECIEKNDIDKLLIDSYYVTDEYLCSISKKVETIYIDDLYKFPYSVDKLINYGVQASEETYKLLYKDKKIPKLYLGTEYIPLREEFMNKRIEIKENVTDVLITSGATDLYDIELKLAKAVTNIKELDGITFHIVVGAFNKNTNKIVELANDTDDIYDIDNINNTDKTVNIVNTANTDRIRVYQNVSNMSEVMLKCDVAISAGGTTLFELAALGIPTIAYTVAENQVKGTEAMAQKGIIKYAGSAQKHEVVDVIIEELIEWCEDGECRIDFGERAGSVVDGKGAERIAGVICDEGV